MQGIIYTGPRWNKLSIGRKQCVKRSLHSGLQNQIRFTAVMVKEWGLSQSSFMSYQKLVGHQSSSGFHPARGQGTVASLGRDTGTEPSKATQRSQGKHAGRELQGKASAAPAYGCSSASWTFGQRRSVANIWLPLLGFNAEGAQKVRTALPNVQQGLGTHGLDVACGRERPRFESPFVLCISLT